jgi:branched-subunit amino acid aminotransferase/4-amino-4-deoxychorismate lyase
MTRELRLSADAPALAHGLGLFETMRVVRGRVVQTEEHLRRMLGSARALGFPIPDEGAFRRAVAEAAKEVAALDEAAVRCMFLETGEASWRLVATAGPIPEATLRRRRRGRAITLSTRRALPEHKLTSYAVSTIGLREAVARGADEGLFLDAEGRVLEGTATNVFAIDGATLITAPVGAGILPGVVRAWVIGNAGRVGFDVVERVPSIEEMRRGSFVTSSLTTLAVIKTVDDVACNVVTRGFAELKRAYLRDA